MDPAALHRDDTASRRVAELGRAFVDARLAGGPALGRTAGRAELAERLGVTITAQGLGPDEAFRRFTGVVAPSTVALDSPRFLAFVPAAPTATSIHFDAVVGACSFSGESWLEAAGAVHTENEVLAWLAGLARLPEGSGGCFVSGGSMGNLSALAVARDVARAGGGARRVVVADSAHASVGRALHLLGLEALDVPTGADGRLSGAAVAKAIARDPDPSDLVAVVASAGSTNGGIVDDLAGIAELAARRDLWFHVDGAYGGAGLLLPELRHRFAGVERADSFIVDPHKWLFGPLDCCALLYRRPDQALGVHRQRASYLEALHVDGEWNPADYAYHLTRRARGLPLWFSLAVHGVDAHAGAVRRGVDLARHAADRIRAMAPTVALVMEPDLSVVLFRRDGWGESEWLAWSRRLLDDGVACVVPTRWRGEAVGRLVFLHPGTTEAVVDEILATLT